MPGAEASTPQRSCGPLGAPTSGSAHQVSSIRRRSKVAQLTAPEPKGCYRAVEHQQGSRGFSWGQARTEGARPDEARAAPRGAGFPPSGVSGRTQWPGCRGVHVGGRLWVAGWRLAEAASASGCALGSPGPGGSWAAAALGAWPLGLEKEAPGPAMTPALGQSSAPLGAPPGPLPPPTVQGRPGCPRCSGQQRPALPHCPSTAASPGTGQ